MFFFHVFQYCSQVLSFPRLLFSQKFTLVTGLQQCLIGWFSNLVASGTYIDFQLQKQMFNETFLYLLVKRNMRTQYFPSIYLMKSFLRLYLTIQSQRLFQQPVKSCWQAFDGCLALLLWPINIVEVVQLFCGVMFFHVSEYCSCFYFFNFHDYFFSYKFTLITSYCQCF